MFKDRKDAGEKLAKVLEKYSNQNVLVLGIPRGGVETAYYVAKHLNAEMSFVVTRKLGYPLNPEAAFGALSEDGSLFIFEDARKTIEPEIVEESIREGLSEIKRRIKVLRKGKPLPKMQGRIVIIVDDGIATGATLFATIETCRKHKAAKIIVAAPVSGERMLSQLKALVDEVYIVVTPPGYYAVSQVYESFNNLTDEEVLDIMNTWDNARTS